MWGLNEERGHVSSIAQKNTGATALAFDLILLCEREWGCGGLLSREREDARRLCSYVVTGGSASVCARGLFGAGREPESDAMRVA